MGKLRLAERPSWDAGVNSSHQADGFREGDDNPLIVLDILVAQRAAFAILEPLLADLIAADMEVPNLLRHAAEELILVDPDAAGSGCRPGALTGRFLCAL